MSMDDEAFNSEKYQPGPEEPAKGDGAGPRPIPPLEGEAAHDGPQTRIVFKSVASFCAEYVPLDYAVDGLVRTSSLYTLTAKTGAGKTSFNIISSLANVTGREDILGRVVAKGRVAYLAAENPDDVRMRFMIAAFLLHIDLDELGDDLVILDTRASPEDILAALAGMASIKPFIAIYVDTLIVFFDGKNISDPVEGCGYTRRWRPLTQIAGKPAVVISAHPVKNATEDQLIPYGSGAILNEVDGNFTLWKNDTGIVSLHWQGKIRGPEFDAPQFHFEITGSPHILDVKGRQVLLPTLRPSTAQAAEERRQSESDIDRALLKAMIAEPNATQQEWAVAIGKGKSRVNARLQKLRLEKVVEVTLGKWVVTARGRKAALDLRLIQSDE